MTTAPELRARWRDGQVALGVWLALPSAFSAELMTREPFDYACIDMQHGLIGYDDFVRMLQGMSANSPVPIVRVPGNESWLIGKVLDAGACGVVVPMVNNAEEAARAVAACRYPPHGIRSYGPVRSSLVLDVRGPRELEERMVCIVMVETRVGLANVEEIAATPGVDAIYIGPADLALGLGFPPDLDKTEPEHVEAVERIRQACRSNGIGAGIQCGSGQSAHRYAEQGFTMITFAKDTSLLESGLNRELAAARGQATSDMAAVPYR